MNNIGKSLLLKVAENIENDTVPFISNKYNGILYNIMMTTPYGYKPLLDEEGYCQFLYNPEKGWEVDAATIWFQVAEEVEIDEEIIRMFVEWCSKQANEMEVAKKLREMYDKHNKLDKVSFI